MGEDICPFGDSCFYKHGEWRRLVVLLCTWPSLSPQPLPLCVYVCTGISTLPLYWYRFSGLSFGPGSGRGLSCGPGSGRGLSCGPGSGTGLNCGPGSGRGLSCGPGSGRGLSCGPGSGTGLSCGPGSGTGLSCGPGSGTGLSCGSNSGKWLGSGLGSWTVVMILDTYTREKFSKNISMLVQRQLSHLNV